ncbi:MAG: peptide-methionine (R)-S-oxide reductase [Bacteroidetes bacterium]|nr:MAG: peptide-methionine (R)-S-oxide reductase [Bacteroidota bacterium]
MLKYLIVLTFLWSCNFSSGSAPAKTALNSSVPEVQDTLIPPEYDAGHQLIRVERTETEWKARLNKLEYNVLREEGTERAFTGDLWNNHEQGIYICKGCGLPLFSSASKFNSGTGWPSYWQPIKPEYVTENKDTRYGMVRIEVECARCGGHLGHVFDDGPKPTGLRYCINSVSLDFVPGASDAN